MRHATVYTQYTKFDISETCLLLVSLFAYLKYILSKHSKQSLINKTLVDFKTVL